MYSQYIYFLNNLDLGTYVNFFIDVGSMNMQCILHFINMVIGWRRFIPKIKIENTNNITRSVSA